MPKRAAPVADQEYLQHLERAVRAQGGQLGRCWDMIHDAAMVLDALDPVMAGKLRDFCVRDRLDLEVFRPELARKERP